MALAASAGKRTGDAPDLSPGRRTAAGIPGEPGTAEALLRRHRDRSAAADGSYSEYAALQQAQALPLASHLGETAVRYTYTQSSPGEAHLRTELLLSEDQILLGAVQYDCTQPEQMSPVMQP